MGKGGGGGGGSGGCGPLEAFGGGGGGGGGGSFPNTGGAGAFVVGLGALADGDGCCANVELVVDETIAGVVDGRATTVVLLDDG